MDYSFKTQPFKHQLDALMQSYNKKDFAYFMEMGCVDEDTEFLTQRGWVKFLDFDLDTWERPLLIAQAIPEPGTLEGDMRNWALEFVEPISYIKKPAYEWYRFNKFKYKETKSDKCFEFTSDHIIPFRVFWSSHNGSGTRTPRRQNFPEGTAAQLANALTTRDILNNYCYKNDEDYSVKYIEKFNSGFRGFNSEYFIPDPELSELTEWELRFTVACIADGTFPNKTNNKCDFQFVKQRKVDRLRMIAQRAGIPLVYEAKKRREDSNPGEGYLHIFHSIAPVRCKVFDERWYSLSYEQLQIVVDEVFRWDGFEGKNNSCFFTVIKESADFIQYALAACGWASTISFAMDKHQYQVIASLSSCYHRRFIRSDEIESRAVDRGEGKLGIMGTFSGTDPHPQLIRDEKMSYCFRVPSGYLVLRKNNKIFVSGNSGKTKVMIDNIGVLHTKGQITGALILAPKGVYRNWSEKEIPTHLPDSIEHEIIVWDAAATDSRKDKLAKQIDKWDGKKLQFLVFNIESLISAKGRKLIVDFIKRHDGNVLALVDESTCIKNHKAKRTKAAVELGAKCKARRIATGSPVTNSPLDLFSQCAFLDKRLLGHGSFYSFKNTYADIEKVQNRQGQSYEKILRYKNLDDLSEKLNRFSFRITKKECLDLPDKIYVTRDVELTPEQAEIYQEMYNNQFALLKTEEGFQEMSTSVVLTKLLRLHQVLCGTFTADDGTTQRIPNNRIDALKEVLEESSGKVIIWANYLDDIHEIESMLCKEYGPQSFVTYYGATSSDDRTKAITLFQDPTSPVRFFLGNTQTAGRGITLTEASTVVYYSNNFSLELRQQSEDRAHRLGQKNKVTYIDLVVRGSLDEKIIKSLIDKRNIANEILKDDLEDWISLNRGVAMA